MTILGYAGAAVAMGLPGPVIAVAMAALTTTPADGPFVVIAAPGSGGAAAVIERAGGWPVGYKEPVIGMLATGDKANFLHDLQSEGAMLVLGGKFAAILCGGSS